jgi:glycine/D-amino acid oxidase-like deaminating enzyme
MANPIRICIIGGGIIGASIGFHLSEAGCSNITIVERTNIACGASGRAGGFLAKNWRSGAEGKFSESSFIAHSELAERLKNEFSIDVMYRRLKTFNLSINEITDKTNQSSDDNSLPKWITANVNGKEMLGNEETTAQVHPGYDLINKI